MPIGLEVNTPTSQTTAEQDPPGGTAVTTEDTISSQTAISTAIATTEDATLAHTTN